MRSAYRKAPIPTWVKRAVVDREGAWPGIRSIVGCQYCDVDGYVWWPHKSGPVRTTLEFDHVYPEVLGGKAVPQNIALACRSCNRSKGSKVNWDA